MDVRWENFADPRASSFLWDTTTESLKFNGSGMSDPVHMATTHDAGFRHPDFYDVSNSGFEAPDSKRVDYNVFDDCSGYPSFPYPNSSSGQRNGSQGAEYGRCRADLPSTDGLHSLRNEEDDTHHHNQINSMLTYYRSL